MSQPRFATAISCRDEDPEDPVVKWIKRKYHVDAVDLIAEPRAVKSLATKPECQCAASIRKRTEQSRRQHGSDLVAVVAHEDCPGTVATKDIQMHYLNAASDLIYTWGLPVDIIRLWVDEHGAVNQLP